MFSSILRWLDGDNDSTSDGHSDAGDERPHDSPATAGPAAHEPSDIDIFNEHVAAIQIATAEGRLYDAVDLMHALAEFLKRQRNGQESSDVDPRAEMAMHLQHSLIARLEGEATVSVDLEACAQLWACLLTLHSPASGCRDRVLSLLSGSISEATARMNSIRRLLQMNGGLSLRPPEAPLWLFQDGVPYPYFNHHASAVRHMMRKASGLLSPIQRISSGDADSEQPHIECLTKIFSAASIVLTELTQRAAEFSVEPAGAIHAACCGPALQTIQTYKQDNLLHITRQVAQAMLDHAYVYDQSMRASRRDILNDLIAIIPYTRRSKGGSSASDAPAHPPHPTFDIQLDLALGIVDESADEVSFLCQVIERYCRFVSTATHTGSMSQPSRLNDELAHVLQEFHGDYVLLERAYIVTSARHAVYAESAWIPSSVHENIHIKTFEWCDSVFFLLSKAIARSIATHNDVAAAATINYVSTCIQDSVLSACMECLSRSNVHSQHSRPPAASLEADELDAALSERFSGFMKKQGIDTTTKTTASATSMSKDATKPPRVLTAPALPPTAAAHSDSITAVNTIITAETFARDLYKRAAAEAAVAFPAFSVDVGFQELGRAIEEVTQLADKAVAQFTHTYFEEGLRVFESEIRKYDFSVKSSVRLDSQAAANQIAECLKVQLISGRERGLQLVLPQLVAPIGVDKVVMKLASIVCLICEQYWFESPMNELGALAIHQQVIAIQEVFIPLTHAPLRSVFRRLHQMTQIVGAANPAELAMLMFPMPALSKAEIQRLLRNHTSFQGQNLDEVSWEKLALP